MSRLTSNKQRYLSSVLIALGIGPAAVTPALAATWSTPVQPPAGCGSNPSANSLAQNPSGALALAGYTQTSSSFTVQVCTSSDGVNWSGPNTIGQGVSPAVAIAPDGRIVAIRQWTSGVMSNTQASVRPPGGNWSTPVIVSPNSGRATIGMDASGNAVAAWAPTTLSQPVEAASLPAGGSWTAVHTLGAKGGVVNLAVSSVGGAVVTWRSSTNIIEAASGTIMGGFGAPVNLGTTYGNPSVFNAPRVALNDAGAAAVAWDNHDHNVVISRTADGTWGNFTELSATPAGIRVAIDGAGNTIAAFSETLASGEPTYGALRPAGGSWGSPTLLSSLNATGPGITEAVGDANGTFVVTWTSGGPPGTVEALTILPGGGFGPSTAAGNGPFNSIKIVPGHAVLWMGSGISEEPVN
jgi:hypothetical protein